MSEYMFGYTRGRLARHTEQRAARIAERHDCILHHINNPGQGWISWFAGPNFGQPFDGAMAAAVHADLEKAGLTQDDGQWLKTI